MTPLYDARGNFYAVITPQALREQGVELPASAEQAARTRTSWALEAVRATCNWLPGQRPEGAKAHRCDGLLVGPFQAIGQTTGQGMAQTTAPFFDLLIVNTDGTLAERSGNGLSIFAQFLTDQGWVSGPGAFSLRVHHDKPAKPSPVRVEPAQADGITGFWLDLGTPSFGPSAVDAHATDAVPFNGREVSQVKPLLRINPQWAHSVFVRLGNPHCITLLGNAQALPVFDTPMQQRLQPIAFAQDSTGSGDPCPAGINLQWACQVTTDEIEARVFERGEGPTASSGTSASAVACAAWAVGWIKAGLVKVKMPGGTAPVRLVEQNGVLRQVSLLGTARLKS